MWTLFNSLGRSSRGPGTRPERAAFSSGPCAPTITFRLATACTPGHGRDVRKVARQRRTLPTSPPAGQIRGRPGADPLATLTRPAPLGGPFYRAGRLKVAGGGWVRAQRVRTTRVSSNTGSPDSYT